jgi:RimJ/RimL family protein N-acetyltransferase
MNEDDAAFLFKLCSNPLVRKPLSMKEHDIGFWRGAIQKWNADPDEEVFIIGTLKPHRDIGWLGVNGLESNSRIAWIKMIAMLPGYWGKGYAAESVDLL